MPTDAELIFGKKKTRGAGPTLPNYTGLNDGSAARQPSDPLADLKAMLNAAGVGGNIGSEADYMAQAREAYAPQLGYLDDAAKSAERRAAASSQALQELYGALSRNIHGQRPQIQGDYNRAIRGTRGAYNSAIDEIGERFDATRSNSAEILKRLGIEQAGSNVVGQSNEAEALLSGILGVNRNGANNALRQMRESAVTYNRSMGNAAKLRGGEAREGLEGQLNEFLQQIASQRAGVQSEMNKYGQGLYQDAAQSAQSNWTDLFDRNMQIKKMEQSMANDRSDYELQLMKAGGGEDRLDPIGEIQALANNLYGNQQGADNAVRAVMDAYRYFPERNGGRDPSLAELMNYISERIKGPGQAPPGDFASLQRLAALLLD